MFSKLVVGMLFSVSAFAVTLPQAGSVAQGGWGKDISLPALTVPLGGLSSRVFLYASQVGDTGGHLYKLVSPSSYVATSAQYKVTTGKTLYCLSLTHAESTNKRYLFGYGTAALVANDTGTAPTGAQYYGPDSTVGTYGIDMNSGGEWTLQNIPYFITFPSASYPFVKVSSANGENFQVYLDCIEQ